MHIGQKAMYTNKELKAIIREIVELNINIP